MRERERKRKEKWKWKARTKNRVIFCLRKMFFFVLVLRLERYFRNSSYFANRYRWWYLPSSFSLHGMLSLFSLRLVFFSFSFHSTDSTVLIKRWVDLTFQPDVVTIYQLCKYMKLKPNWMEKNWMTAKENVYKRRFFCH